MSLDDEDLLGELTLFDLDVDLLIELDLFPEGNFLSTGFDDLDDITPLAVDRLPFRLLLGD